MMRGTEKGGQASQEIVAEQFFASHIRIIFVPDSFRKSENVTGGEGAMHKDLESERARVFRTL